jgi:hypothetical protein
MAHLFCRINRNVSDLFEHRCIISHWIDSNGDYQRKPLAATVTHALQQLDSVWEVLYLEEQARILQLTIESVTVSKDRVDIHFLPMELRRWPVIRI